MFRLVTRRYPPSLVVTIRRRRFVLPIVPAALAFVPLGAQTTAQAQSEPPVDARTWLGHAAEIESYLKTVQMLKFEDLSVGVTKPKRAFLPEGGPMKYLAWKMIPPARYDGYWESYRSEIAAYELDKILELNMVPPAVDKVYRGEHGAAIMWVSPTKSFKELGGTGSPTPPARLQAAWNRQLVRAKMFHNLIANLDPNLGNWLVDPAWNLILIDCSRCFTSDQKMTHVLTRVDPTLWDRMKALTEDALLKTIGPLMASRGELRAIIRRRDAMQKIIDALVKERGEAYVFMKDGF